MLNHHMDDIKPRIDTTRFENGSELLTLKTGTGQYTLTFNSSVVSVVYSVIGGLRNGVGYISYNGTAATGVNILTYVFNPTTQSYSQVDSAFKFYILS